MKIVLFKKHQESNYPEKHNFFLCTIKSLAVVPIESLFVLIVIM